MAKGGSTEASRYGVHAEPSVPCRSPAEAAAGTCGGQRGRAAGSGAGRAGSQRYDREVVVWLRSGRADGADGATGADGAPLLDAWTHPDRANRPASLSDGDLDLLPGAPHTDPADGEQRSEPDRRFVALELSFEHVGDTAYGGFGPDTVFEIVGTDNRHYRGTSTRVEGCPGFDGRFASR